MLNAWTILLLSLGYLSLLFTIANVGDRRAQVGRSLISNPYIYALSMAVYCTAWTFYGSVGRAASTGVGFLPIYLGPTLMAPLWWLVLRKIIRISKVHRITAIADFIAARYGKTNRLAGLVTLIAVLGVVPYIALQLKAISTSFQVLTAYPSAPAAGPTGPELVAYVQDPGFLMVIGLALFTILFGARHLDATERHEGLVAAIAFESIVKLVAFLAVGLFVTYGMYEGLGDIFDQAAAQPALDALFLMDHEALPASTWIWHTALSMLAILFLPRQFQVAVVENVDERHLDKAIWLFPLYLFLINLFVLPIAFGGLLAFPDGTVDADTFVLTLPLAAGRVDLALLAYLGGLSAATGMVIVATIALSTMISNDLVMPTLLRIPALRLDAQGDLTTLLLRIRRGSIVVVLLMAYVYFNLVGAVYDLVSIGLISFAAVAQFGPALLGGIYWKRGTRAGALAGLLVGFLVWIYTLALPSLAQPGGLLPPSFLTDGPWGLTLLHPYQLFGLTGPDTISHALFWSLLLNTGLYVGVSLFTRRSVLERVQAVAFVDVFAAPTAPFVRGTARIQDVQTLLARFMGLDKAQAALGGYAARHHVDLRRTREADPDLIQHAETVLAGTIGSASARLMIATVVQERPFSMDEVLHILDETQEVIAYSQALEQKSRDLEQAKEALQQANDRLQDLDRMKDDFVSTVTHELRTP
ncbi:MAG: histidine kinase, partial [Bacteroidota bacterium]